MNKVSRNSLLSMMVFSILSLFLISLNSCKEETPYIELKPEQVLLTDTTYIKSTADSVQPHNVLIEDFTGVRCGNCPRGHRVIEDLKTNYTGRIVALALHGFQSPGYTSPYSGYEDFRIPETQRVYDIIGLPNGLPYGSFDRIKFSSIVIGEWQSNAKARMDSNSYVRLAISNKVLKSTDNKFQAKYYMSFTEDINENVYYSIAILEYDIISRQKDDDAPVQDVLDYHHQNITRGFPVFLKQLNTLPTTEKGRTYEKEFEVVLPENIQDYKNCSVVFMVHKANQILQVIEERLD